MQFLARRISALGILYVCNILIFKKFVFLLVMQALRHSGCWCDNNVHIPLLDNNDNNAFVGKRIFLDGVAPKIEN